MELRSGGDHPKNPLAFRFLTVCCDTNSTIDKARTHGKIVTLRLWWNGIHNGLKIRRRKLASSNLASRTNAKEAPSGLLCVGLLFKEI